MTVVPVHVWIADFGSYAGSRDALRAGRLGCSLPDATPSEGRHSWLSTGDLAAAAAWLHDSLLSQGWGQMNGGSTSTSGAAPRSPPERGVAPNATLEHMRAVGHNGPTRMHRADTAGMKHGPNCELHYCRRCAPSYTSDARRTTTATAPPTKLILFEPVVVDARSCDSTWTSLQLHRWFWSR